MKTLTLSAGLLLTVAASTLAQTPGTLDKTFGTGGKVITSFGGNTNNAYAIAIQPDGKIIIAGATSNGITGDFAITRLKKNGDPDNTFGSAGKVVTSISNTSFDVAWGAALQADGKIVVVGNSSNGIDNDFAVVRYNTNGSLDNTFDDDGIQTTDLGSTDIARSVAIQIDGKIVVAGESGNYFATARYNPDGSPDNSFDGDGSVLTSVGNINDAHAQAVAIQPDGKILVAGYAFQIPFNDFALVRYNTNGSLDNTFDDDGKVTTAIGGSDDIAYGIALQPDGKIILAGTSLRNSTTYDVALVRYKKNGALDKTFAFDGKTTTPFRNNYISEARSVAITPEGKIVIGGRSYASSGPEASDFILAQYNQYGLPDYSFSLDGNVKPDFGNSIEMGFAVAVQTDSKIIIAGQTGNFASNNDMAIARYNGKFNYDAAIAANNSSLSKKDDTVKTVAVNIYPNPATNYFIIQGLNGDIKTHLRLVDLTGKIIESKSCTAFSYYWNISTLPKGMYYILIDDGINRNKLKLNKQ